MIENPAEFIHAWMQHINKGNLEGLLALYAPEAILIPTFSNRLLNEPGKIRKYFEALASREELSLALHDNTLLVQELRNGMHALSGIYCWRFAVDGELLSFEARFSFLVDLKREDAILQHHSSQIPRTL